MDGRGNAGRAARLGETVAILGDDGVLGPDRSGARHQKRHLDHRSEPLIVAIGPVLPRGDLAGEQAKLLQKDRRLNRIEPAVEADIFEVRPAWSLAVIAQREQAERLVVVIGEDGAAVAIAAERLGGIEAGRRVCGKRTDLAPGEARAKTLRRVADNEHSVRLGDLVDGTVVRRLAVEIDRDDATWLKSA